ncbi:MAG: FAD-binding oxidoreductase [Frankiales bacterium]|nr:FAD-binding oxidoreductase [Frankiales bacterium]
MSAFDVGIVGGGVHGAAAAYALGRRGVSVVVFERGGVASGPTGQASGVVRSYYTNTFLAEAARDSTVVLAEFGDRTGGGRSGYRRTGGLHLHGPDDVADVTRTVTGLVELGIDAELLTAHEVGQRFPSVDTAGVAIAVWEASAGYADPAATTAGLLADAVGNGVVLRTGTRVLRIDELGPVVRVSLDDGTHQDVGRLLVAAGPWTRPLVRQIGWDLPLTVERHLVVSQRTTSGDTFPHVLLDVAGGYYARPHASSPDGVDDGTWLGAMAPTPGIRWEAPLAAPTAAEEHLLTSRAARRVPSRAGAVIDRSWASVYDVSPDWQPVIGRVGERTFVDAGTSGHGFKLAPALGEHVARLLTGDPDPRLATFSPDRFTSDRTLTSGFGTARILG